MPKFFRNIGIIVLCFSSVSIFAACDSRRAPKNEADSGKGNPIRDYITVPKEKAAGAKKKVEDAQQEVDRALEDE